MRCPSCSHGEAMLTHVGAPRDGVTKSEVWGAKDNDTVVAHLRCCGCGDERKMEDDGFVRITEEKVAEKRPSSSGGGSELAEPSAAETRGVRREPPLMQAPAVQPAPAAGSGAGEPRLVRGIAKCAAAGLAAEAPGASTQHPLQPKKRERTLAPAERRRAAKALRSALLDAAGKHSPDTDHT